MDRTHVSFVVFEVGNDLQAVTKLMDIAPTDAWRVGDPVPDQPTTTRNHSQWTLASGCGLEAPVEDHLHALLTILEERRQRIREVALRYAVELQCAIYYEEDTPGIHLSEDVVRRVAALGLAIDLDLYFVGGENAARH
jgi:hypothetical protein